MSESEDKKIGKNKASRRDRLLSQGFPLLVCAAIIGFVLFNEMRPSFTSQREREPVPANTPAQNEEQQGEGENAGSGAGKEEEGGSKEMRSAGVVSNAIDEIKKSAEAVKNLFAEQFQPAASRTSAFAADSDADREFVEARLSNIDDSASVKQAAKDILWGSTVLSDIKCKLADRHDLDINLSIELFYNSKALSLEVSQKQAILGKVAQQVVSGIEFGTVQNTMLRARLLNAFNNVLETGQLWKVDIKNFDIY
ncbi:MAG: hypothetical protein FWE57_02880 [Chitinispirillia bacterium]|nr:hypothetical protein [Chitinispirillia bacterium]